MDKETSRILIDEADFIKLKQLISELKHVICNIKYTEYTNPNKTRKPFTEEEKQLISALQEQGFSGWQISKQLGRNYNGVRNHLKTKAERLKLK